VISHSSNFGFGLNSQLKITLIATTTTTTTTAVPNKTTTNTTITESDTRPKHNQLNTSSFFWKIPTKEAVESKDKGSKPETAELYDVEALRSSTQVMGQEVKQVELRLHSAEQKLRDLNINIR